MIYSRGLEFIQLKVSIPEEVLFRDLGGESVLLHLGSGQYFGLDEVGTMVWNLLAQGCDLAEVKDRLLEQYDAEPKQVRIDLDRIVGELCDHGLLTLLNEPAAG